MLPLLFIKITHFIPSYAVCAYLPLLPRTPAHEPSTSTLCYCYSLYIYYYYYALNFKIISLFSFSLRCWEGPASKPFTVSLHPLFFQTISQGQKDKQPKPPRPA